MSAFFGDMMKTFSSGPLSGLFRQNQASNWMKNLEQFGGFPIVTKIFDGGGIPVSESKLTSVTTADLSEADFSVPKKYKQQKMDMKGGF